MGWRKGTFQWGSSGDRGGERNGLHLLWHPKRLPFCCPDGTWGLLDVPLCGSPISLHFHGLLAEDEEELSSMRMMVFGCRAVFHSVWE